VFSGKSRICAGQFQRYYYGLGTLPAPRARSLLAWETGGEPAQSGVGHKRYFMYPKNNVKSMTPNNSIFLHKHMNYTK